MADLELASALLQRLKDECSDYDDGIVLTGSSVDAERARAIIESDRAAVREPLENELASTKEILNELHGYVAQMCQHFGDKLEEVPCDAWRLRDHVIRAVKHIASLEAQLASARERVALEWETLDDAAEQLDGDEQEARSAMLSRVEALLTSPPKSPSLGTCEPNLPASPLTTADLVSMLEAGQCVDLRDHLVLTSVTEPLREELLELRRLRQWRQDVRAEVHRGATGFAALDYANSRAMGDPLPELPPPGDQKEPL